MLTRVIPSEFDLFVGIDTSKRSYAVTYTNHQRVSRSFKMPADPQQVYTYFQKRFAHKRLLFVYEAGCTGYDLYDQLTHRRENCLVVHPAGVKKAMNSRTKNDRIDSYQLADQARGGQLAGIRVPDDAYRELRHLATTRQQQVKDAQRTKKRILSLLLFENIQLPKEIESSGHWSSPFRQALKTLRVKNRSIRFQLDTDLKDLEHKHQQILSVHRELRLFYNAHPEIQQHIGYLRSIPGFGFVVSMYLLSRIGDPKHLRNQRELASFAGLVPSEHSTGQTQRKGSITRTGDAMLRSLLVEAAWIAIRKDTELRQFYERIRARNNPTKASKVAIVAVASKLTRRAHRVLKEQRDYLRH
jgi:transposase